MPPSPDRDAYYIALRLFLLAHLPTGIEIIQAQDNRVAEPAGPDYVILNEIGRRRLSANVTSYADCTFSGTISGTTLTVTSVRIGRIVIGTRLVGQGVASGTTIAAQVSGHPGCVGTYTLSTAQTQPIPGVVLATGAALIVQPTEVTIQADIYGPASADNTTIATTLLRDGYAALWFDRQGYADQGIGVLDVGEPRQMAFVNGEQQYEDRWSFDVKLQVNQTTSPPQDFADAIDLDIHPPADNRPH